MATEQQWSDRIGRPREDDASVSNEESASCARSAGQETLSQAEDRAEGGKNRAAEGVDHASDAVRDAAQRLQEQEPWLADLVSRGADELAHLAETLRTSDLRSMLSRTEELSRRQPMLVAGAAFAAGFAAMRAVRSGGGPAAAGLSDVAADALETARRETNHAKAETQQAAEEVSSDRREHTVFSASNGPATESRSAGLGR